eukprot:Nk52_evm1s924 gene=Nk52_evmTU1s924
MNTAVVKHLGFSPMELLFGRNVVSPTLDNLRHDDRWQYMSRVIIPLAKGRSLKARHTMKKAYDRFHGVKPSDIQVGEVVYVARPSRGRKKYSALFDGPYIVHSVNAEHKSVRVMDPLVDVELL